MSQLGFQSHQESKPTAINPSGGSDFKNPSNYDQPTKDVQSSSSSESSPNPKQSFKGSDLKKDLEGNFEGEKIAKVQTEEWTRNFVKNHEEIENSDWRRSSGVKNAQKDLGTK